MSSANTRDRAGSLMLTILLRSLTVVNHTPSRDGASGAIAIPPLRDGSKGLAVSGSAARRPERRICPCGGHCGALFCPQRGMSAAQAGSAASH